MVSLSTWARYIVQKLDYSITVGWKVSNHPDPPSFPFPNCRTSVFFGWVWWVSLFSVFPCSLDCWASLCFPIFASFSPFFEAKRACPSIDILIVEDMNIFVLDHSIWSFCSQPFWENYFLLLFVNRVVDFSRIVKQRFLYLRRYKNCFLLFIGT